MQFPVRIRALGINLEVRSQETATKCRVIEWKLIHFPATCTMLRCTCTWTHSTMVFQIFFFGHLPLFSFRVRGKHKSGSTVLWVKNYQRDGTLSRIYVVHLFSTPASHWYEWLLMYSAFANIWATRRGVEEVGHSGWWYEFYNTAPTTRYKLVRSCAPQL